MQTFVGGYKVWLIDKIYRLFNLFVKANLQIDFSVKVTACLDNLVSTVSSFHTKYMAGINFQ